jgi:hypothetical protein
MGQASIAFQGFIKALRRIPCPSAFVAIRQAFAELTGSGFLVRNKPWLNAAELAALSKFLVLYGDHNSRASVFDLAKPMNRYKRFWKYAEAESPYNHEAVARQNTQ